MRALHLCFWLHRPYELMPADRWQKGYFGGEEEFRRADQQHYQPLFALLERNAQRYPELRVSLVVSGAWLEQAERWDKELIRRLQKLIQNGNVALVATPYYYSMAAFYDLDELAAQLKHYQEKIQQLFGTTSEFLVLPELCYNNRIARWVDKAGYRGMLAGDAKQGLDWRTSNRIYEAKGTDGLRVLFKNRLLSQNLAQAEAIATVKIAKEVKVAPEDLEAEPEDTQAEVTAADFVRSMTHAAETKRQAVAETTTQTFKTEFSAKKFQKQLDLAFLRGDIVNLYLDAEIFGHWRELGIIGFFDELFKIWHDLPGAHLVSVREIAKLSPVSEISLKKTVSDLAEAAEDYQIPATWWSKEQDQQARELYDLRKSVLASEDKDLYIDYVKLTAIENADASAEYAAILADVKDRLSKLVTQTQTDEKFEPVRFGLTESTSVRINFDTKAKEAKERNQAFYQQLKDAAGDPLWSAEDMDDMEAAIQVMAQRMKMSHLEKERDFTDFVEAEVVGTEADFADMEDPNLVDLEEEERRTVKNSVFAKKSKEAAVEDDEENAKGVNDAEDSKLNAKEAKDARLNVKDGKGARLNVRAAKHLKVKPQKEKKKGFKKIVID